MSTTDKLGGDSSLHQLDGRASDTETVNEERRWWAIELMSTVTGWCRVEDRFKSLGAAKAAMEKLDFNGRARLVEVVERTQTVGEWKAGSPIA